MTLIKSTTTKVLLTTLGAAALLFTGTTTASAHMNTTTGSTAAQTTQATTQPATATTTAAQNTSYHHTAANTTVTATTNTATTSSTATSTSTANTGGAVAKALAVANSGVPYVYGGSSMSGFDCSGLVQYAFGLSARTTYQQANLGTHHYDVANAPAGAILFWGSDSAPYHDGISLGNGKYVAAQNESDGIGVFSQTYWPASFYIVVN
ncbi:C40 family peptidase [Levilactobacillus tujiorum]|uniref:C40 family peptidase n=1 Tax=Levilactobacillus tujiorum TaxID=2912243 RepID=A0ABX1L3P7_9LACO|nr:C40 family peptidase [Levilactobacillus tujiorum]NLR11847.1 C40 family peptidase [Lactobacillus sp. HBUAS51387]NLR29652.1 C40 family peptidase [Levilactobacillus tujiorum]